VYTGVSDVAFRTGVHAVFSHLHVALHPGARQTTLEGGTAKYTMDFIRATISESCRGRLVCHFRMNLFYKLRACLDSIR